VKDSARMAAMFRRLYEFPKPTSPPSTVQLAGGSGLAAMCDFTLAVAEANVGYPKSASDFVPAIVSSILVWQSATRSPATF